MLPSVLMFSFCRSLTCLRPGGLVQNWIDETKKWFPSDKLRLKRFSAKVWNADRAISTIWIVTDKSTQNIDYFLESNVSVAAMIADEWHIYGRSDPTNVSQRLQQIWKLTGKAAFVCQMSGTLFPNGPRNDAEVIMRNLGGSWVAEPKKNAPQPKKNAPQFSKWNNEQVERLQYLFEKVAGGRRR